MAQILGQIKDNQASICSQLQMGEGKTSVILPILCSLISDRTKVIRVNVIPSLLETNVSLKYVNYQNHLIHEVLTMIYIKLNHESRGVTKSYGFHLPLLSHCGSYRRQYRYNSQSGEYYCCS